MLIPAKATSTAGVSHKYCEMFPLILGELSEGQFLEWTSFRDQNGIICIAQLGQAHSENEVTLLQIDQNRNQQKVMAQKLLHINS